MLNNAIKEVYTFNKKSKIIDSNFSNKQNAEYIGKSVGRVFIRCLQDNKKKFYCTTGFCISDDTVVSYFSKNAISHQHSEYQQSNYKIEKIYIFFGNNATINIEIDLNCLENDSDFFELEILHDHHVDDSSIQQQHTNESDFLSDLTFLKFKDRKPKLDSYIFPGIHITNTTINNSYYVIGFANHTEYTTMKKDNTELTQTKYNELCRHHRNFQHKTLYKCKDVERSDRLISFKASTIRGTAGGIMGALEHHNTISGIYIGGSLTTKYALSVTHPIFYNRYKRYITQDFIAKHHQILRPYFDYCDNHGD